MENTDPMAATSLYREAINRGLDRKVYNAARWRLYYIYKQLDEYEEGIFLLNSFGEAKQIENVRQSLISQIAYYYGISEESATSYASGLAANRQKPGEALKHFIKSLSGSKNKYKLRNDIMKILLRNGRDEDAKQIFSITSETPVDEMISKADILVGRKNWDEAKAILVNLSIESYSLSEEQKYKILYLMGKLERGKNNEPSALIYFRQASRYEKKDNGFYSSALSAYSLYRQGNAKSAYGLMKDYKISEDPNIELLQLILLVEVRKDISAFDRLKLKEESLRRDSSFLAMRALKLLGKSK
jgi:hypothetical protein